METLSRSTVKIWQIGNKIFLERKPIFIWTSWRKQRFTFSKTNYKKWYKIQSNLGRRCYRKIIHSTNILDLPATIQLCKMWRRQSTTEMLKQKENFKCYGIKTRPAKDRQVLYCYKILYSRYIDWNFSLDSNKNLLHSCDILAKCGVDNQQLKSSSERKIWSVLILKTRSTKNR